ncbi:hypothetical protein [Bradyrhizobium sp. LA6.12]|uniref:hypothetical protein n=1 Tax=unclassified Bradyrhizobium TaxID=2631580 RepID=UPI00339A0D09
MAARRTVCGGMLAFDGGALALIAIRCTGITPNERGRFARLGGQARSADIARRSFEIDGCGHDGIDARACSSDQLRDVSLLSLMP